jgi:hypothetical protein
MEQQWETVVIRNKKMAPKQTVERKGAQGTEAQRLYKLDQSEATPVKKRLTEESRRALMAARIAKDKKQRDVEKELALPGNTLRDIENGAVVPTSQQISALHRYFSAQKLVLRIESF